MQDDFVIYSESGMPIQYDWQLNWNRDEYQWDYMHHATLPVWYILTALWFVVALQVVL